MTGPEFRTFMERFLVYADNGLGKGFNYAWSGGTTIAAIVALVLLWDDPGSISFVLTAIGLGVLHPNFPELLDRRRPWSPS